jgi:hypothetical protein
MSTVMQQKRGAASRWTSANPTLLAGEIGFETDTNKMKIGDGVTAWNSPAYVVANSIGSYQPVTTPYNFSSAPSTTWSITHSLPYQPSVTTTDTSGNVIEGSVDYTSSTTISIVFSVATTGYAYLA